MDGGKGIQNQYCSSQPYFYMSIFWLDLDVL